MDNSFLGLVTIVLIFRHANGADVYLLPDKEAAHG